MYLLLQLWCPNGYYSAVAQLYFQSPEESVKSLFHSPVGRLKSSHVISMCHILLMVDVCFLATFRPATLAAFALVYYGLACWTYGVSVPSGLFIPALLTGAAWGRLIGVGIEYFFPDVVSESAIDQTFSTSIYEVQW